LKISKEVKCGSDQRPSAAEAPVRKQGGVSVSGELGGSVRVPGTADTSGAGRAGRERPADVAEVVPEKGAERQEVQPEPETKTVRDLPGGRTAGRLQPAGKPKQGKIDSAVFTPYVLRYPGWADSRHNRTVVNTKFTANPLDRANIAFSTELVY
jgi:hypothetical protein